MNHSPRKIIRQYVENNLICFHSNHSPRKNCIWVGSVSAKPHKKPSTSISCCFPCYLYRQETQHQKHSLPVFAFLEEYRLPLTLTFSYTKRTSLQNNSKKRTVFVIATLKTKCIPINRYLYMFEIEVCIYMYNFIWWYRQRYTHIWKKKNPSSEKSYP